jgi:hypothetical protein
METGTSRFNRQIAGARCCVKGLDSVKVVQFTGDRVPNDFPGGELPWQMYHGVRNALVETCRKYGPIGPMGRVKILQQVEDPYIMRVEDTEFWESGDPDPWYYIITDQYNQERYCYTELYGDEPFSTSWLVSVMATLREFEGWGLGVTNIPDSYVLIFGKRLMVKGRLAKCKSAQEVVETASKLLKSGNKRWWQFWK